MRIAATPQTLLEPRASTWFIVGMSPFWKAEPDLLQEFFRFAMILHADRQKAREVVEAALHTLEGKPEVEDMERAIRYLFARIRRSAPKHRQPGPAHDPISIIHDMPDPVRQAAALFYSSSLSPSDMARVLGLPKHELANLIHAARIRVSSLLEKPQS